jgi:membrane fusion protein (multidrug efflux system)
MRARRQIRRRAAARLPRGVVPLLPALLVVPSVGGLLSLAGCGADGSDHWKPRETVVEVMRVEPEPLVDVAVFSGQLDAEHSVEVRPEIEGIVESIEFEQGQAVSEGDVLFRLRSREQVARLREAEANRNLAQVKWERAKQLLSHNAESRAAADVVRAEYEIARARVDVARLELDRTRIRAPFDGVVGARSVDIGARVDEETELVRLDAVDRLQLTFAISDEGLPFAHPGMKVEAWVRPYPGETFSGEVFFVSPSLDPSNRRIWVKAWIDNKERRLAPGLFANVNLELRRVDAAIVVPESAIAIDRQGPHVWKIDDDNKAVRLPIEIGLREHGIVEVVQGLPAGTRVVTAGTHKVSEGKVVKIADRPLVERARRTPPEGALIGEGT